LTATPATEKVGFSMAEMRITILSHATVILTLILTALYDVVEADGVKA